MTDPAIQTKCQHKQQSVSVHFVFYCVLVISAFVTVCLPCQSQFVSTCSRVQHALAADERLADCGMSDRHRWNSTHSSPDIAHLR